MVLVKCIYIVYTNKRKFISHAFISCMIRLMRVSSLHTFFITCTMKLYSVRVLHIMESMNYQVLSNMLVCYNPGPSGLYNLQTFCNNNIILMIVSASHPDTMWSTIDKQPEDLMLIVLPPRIMTSSNLGMYNMYVNVNYFTII